MKPRQPIAHLCPISGGEARDMVPSPARGQGDRWERWGRKASPVTTATSRTPDAAAGFGYATGLSCRECGQVYELGPLYACGECFGPLEVCYDYPPLTRADIEAGPPNMWRYAALLPVPPDIAQRPTTEPGYTRLIRADNLAARARHAQAVDQGRPRQPDALVQGPGGRGGPRRRHRAGLQGAGLPVHRQPGQRRRRRGGPGRHPFRGARARRPGAAEDHHHRGVRRHVRHRGRHLRRREPARLRAGGRA